MSIYYAHLLLFLNTLFIYLSIYYYHSKYLTNISNMNMNKFKPIFNTIMRHRNYNNYYILNSMNVLSKKNFHAINNQHTLLSNKYSILSSKPFSTTNENKTQEQQVEDPILDINPEVEQPIEPTEPTEQTEFTSTNKEHMSFKAETKKLLEIVTHSLYTDKEVFLRELLSNCSDALEKQRYLEQAGKLDMIGEPFFVNITTNEKNKTLTIFDSGVGMTKEEMIDNLGTIAKSGTQGFLKNINSSNSQETGKETSNSNKAENLIGQFGVGFYSSFIVGDMIDVISKQQNSNKIHKWSSDGSGDFEISDVSSVDFTRGTKIVIHLKPECRDFSRGSEIIKIAKKYSNFISYSIKINGEVINNVQAIWYRPKKEISSEEYQKFYEIVNNQSKLPYKYLLHFASDIPLDIKTIMYIPSANPEKFGMGEEQPGLSLYSKKVLIKQKCVELIPRFLRFVKGVVDCADIPLSISRESYQDSSLIFKLKTVLTKRILKKLEDELKVDPDSYDKWYEDFNQYLKEGLLGDSDNQESLFRLQRFKCNTTGNSKRINIEDYLKKMLKDQSKVYFLVVASDKGDMENNVFLENFQGTELPILYSNNPVDEMIFRQINQYKDYKFLNIENESDDFLEKIRNEQGSIVSKIPEDEISSYTLWLKNELEPYVAKVSLSKRLQNTPMLVSSDMSANMKGFMAMMNQNTDPNSLLRNLNLEINPANEIIVNLNELRKSDPKAAGLMTKLMFDASLSQSNLSIPNKDFVKRTFNVSKQFIEMKLEQNLKNKENVDTDRITEDDSSSNNEKNINSNEDDLKVNK